MNKGKYLLAQDAISGKSGKAIATINGRVRELFEIRNLKATITKKKVEFNAIGHMQTQHKATGATGTGSVTYYNITSEWAKLMAEYFRTGIDIYFDMIIINEDPSSKIGRQEVKLERCNLNSADIAGFDVDANFIDATAGFTFEGCDIQHEFNEY